MLVHWIALICTTFSASAFTPEDLLARSVTQKSARVQVSRDQRFNPFSSVEIQHQFRTGEIWDTDAFHNPSNGLSARRSDLTLKVTTKGIFEAREYSRLTDALVHEAELADAYVTSVQLRSGYMLLIKTARAQEEVALARSLQQFRERSRRLGALQARVSTKAAKDIFKSGLNSDKTAEILSELEARRSEVEARLKGLGIENAKLDATSLLSPGEIGKRLGQLRQGTLSADQIQAKVATDRAHVAYAYEKQRHLFDGYELGVIESEGEKIMRFGVTLNLWFLASKDVDSQRDRIRLSQSEAEATVKSAEASERVAGLTRQLQDKIAFYEEMASDPLTVVSSSRLMRADPALANEMEDFRTQRRERALALSEEIRSLYVDLLFESRTLSEQPRVNHLSKTKAAF